ncbi:O-antigen ligase family protein [Neiella marina]|uniref:O-antigen ligase family protein n=1 Tax=Neiella holothuriorum TaxID=2870530 RepID=A0ABS7EH09_9GAMM|nr:O-antigen ligase family protein [Neiella holothuriorum]MBW8191629.1 O-antigen ligase family protein [Neiella holothuriorum]
MLHVLLFFSTYLTGLIYSLWRNPAMIFVLYEAVYFFNPKVRWWSFMVPNLPYSMFVVLAMFVIFALTFKQANQNPIFKVPQLRWMLMLGLLYLLVTVNAVLPDFHHQATIYYLKMMLIVCIAYKLVDSAKKIDWALWGYIFGSWYIGIVAFQTGRNSSGRVEGIGTVDSPDANGIAAAIAPSLVLCLYYFWIRADLKSRVALAFAGVFIANGIVLINSRGAFLAVALSIAYFMYHMYFSSFQRKNQKKFAVFITIVGLLGAVKIMDSSFIERMHTMATHSSEQTYDDESESGSTRFIFWASAWEMSKDHPMGAGFRAFNFYAPYYIPEDIDTGGSRHRSVHSSWFETLTETGFIGLFVMCMMIWASLRSTKQCKRVLKDTGQVDDYFKVIAIEGALIAFVIAMTFLNRMRAEVLYWCILYTACAYNVYVLKTRPLVQKSVRGDG